MNIFENQKILDSPKEQNFSKKNSKMSFEDIYNKKNTRFLNRAEVVSFQLFPLSVVPAFHRPEKSGKNSKSKKKSFKMDSPPLFMGEGPVSKNICNFSLKKILMFPPPAAQKNISRSWQAKFKKMSKLRNSSI
jgi:hypothetical protein